MSRIEITISVVLALFLASLQTKTPFFGCWRSEAIHLSHIKGAIVFHHPLWITAKMVMKLHMWCSTEPVTVMVQLHYWDPFKLEIELGRSYLQTVCSTTELKPSLSTSPHSYASLQQACLLLLHWQERWKWKLETLIIQWPLSYSKRLNYQN